MPGETLWSRACSRHKHMLEFRGGERPTGKSIYVSLGACMRAFWIPRGNQVQKWLRPFEVSLSPFRRGRLSLFPCPQGPILDNPALAGFIATERLQKVLELSIMCYFGTVGYLVEP